MNANNLLDKYLKTMAHLSNENERVIIKELLKKDQLGISDFEKKLDMTKSSIMRLLKGMEEDGIVEIGELDEKRAGRKKKFYKLKNINLPGMNVQDIREFLLEEKLPKGVQSKEITAKFDRMKRVSVRGKAGLAEFDPTLLVSDLILSGLDVIEAIDVLLEFEPQLWEGILSEDISDGISKLLEKKDKIYAERYRNLVKKEIFLEPLTRKALRMEDISEIINDEFGLKENEIKLLISEFGRFLEFLGYYKLSYHYLMQTIYLLARKYRMDVEKPSLGSLWIPEGSELMVIGKNINKKIFSAMLRSKESTDVEKKEIRELEKLFDKYYKKLLEKTRELRIMIPPEEYVYHRKINVLKRDNIPDYWEARNFGKYIERKFHLDFHMGQYIGTEVFRKLLHLNLEKVPLSFVDELCKEILVEKGMRTYEKPTKKPTTGHFFKFKGISILSKSEKSSALNYLLENLADKENSKQIHIHGINGWLAVPSQLIHDLRWFLTNRFNFRPVTSPPENLTELIQLIIRIIEEFSSEVALSQGFDFFNILISPFFKGMEYEAIKRYIRLLFSELDRKTCDIGFGIELETPEFLGGHDIWTKQKTGTYNDFERESLSIAKAILEVLAEGDLAGNLYQNPKVILKLRKNSLNNSEILEIVQSIIEKYPERTISGFPPPLIMANCVNDLSSSSSSYFCNGQSIQLSNWENSFGVSNLQTISLRMPEILSCAPVEDEAIKGIAEIADVIVSGLMQKEDIIRRGTEKKRLPLLSMPVWEGRNHYLNLEDSFSTIGISQMRKALFENRGHFLEESEDVFEFGLRLVRSVQASIDRHVEGMGSREFPILVSQTNLFSSIQRYKFYEEWLPIQFTEANISREERIQHLLKGGKIFFVEKPDTDFQESLVRLTHSSVNLFAFVPKEKR